MRPKKYASNAVAGILVVAAICGLASTRVEDALSGWPDIAKNLKFVSIDKHADIDTACSFPDVWLSPNELVVQTFSQAGPGLEAINTDTNSRHDVTSIQRHDYRNLACISPNGRWLLWDYWISYGVRGYGAFAATIDSSKVGGWDREVTISPAAWLPDSRHWVAAVSIPDGVDPDTNKPNLNKEVAVVDASSGVATNYRIAGFDGICGNFRIDPSGCLLISDCDFDCRQKWPTISISHVNLADPIPYADAQIAKAPYDMEGRNASYYVSPDCSRILWHVKRPDISWYDMLWQNRAVHNDGRNHDCDEFYVSDIYGLNMKKIGRIHDSDCQMPVAWSPDGKRIAIVTGDQVAIIDVP